MKVLGVLLLLLFAVLVSVATYRVGTAWVFFHPTAGLVWMIGAAGICCILDDGD